MTRAWFHFADTGWMDSAARRLFLRGVEPEELGPSAFAIRVGAAKLAIAPNEYLRHVRAGERWCSLGKHWVRGQSIRAGGGGCRRCDSARNLVAYARRRAA